MEDAPGDKHTAILEVALRLISENGFHGTPMSLVAREANVGVGTIYRYFESKEALLGSLYSHLKRAMNQAMLAGFAEEAPPRAKFRRVLLNLLRYYINQPAAFKFMEQYAHSPFISAETRRQNAAQYAPIEAFIRHLQEQQIIKPISLAVLMALAYGTMSFLAKRHIDGEGALTEAMIEEALDACWDAVKR